MWITGMKTDSGSFLRSLMGKKGLILGALALGVLLLLLPRGAGAKESPAATEASLSLTLISSAGFKVGRSLGADSIAATRVSGVCMHNAAQSTVRIGSIKLFYQMAKCPGHTPALTLQYFSPSLNSKA